MSMKIIIKKTEFGWAPRRDVVPEFQFIQRSLGFMLVFEGKTYISV